MNYNIIVVLIVTLCVHQVFSANILFLTIFCSKSHRNVFEPLIQGLAAKGHKCTVHSPFPNPKSHPNVKEVDYEEVREFMNNPPPASFDPYTMGQTHPLLQGLFVYHFITPPFWKRALFEMPQLKQLRDSKEHYDLVIVDGFFNEGAYGFSWHFKAPLVLLSTSGSMAWTASAIGIHDLPSIDPMMFGDGSEAMTFIERVRNTINTYVMNLIWMYMYIPKIDGYLQRFFESPDVPSVDELGKEVPLTLINAHLSINYPRALPPGAIEVGGMHVKPPKPLPKDLQKWANGTGPTGFVYFSLGSVTNGSKMPERVRREFVEAFSRIPQQVLWKWETEKMEGLPKNARLGKWLPQQDILGHPNVRAFITHGGLLSFQEAIYNGVPVVGMALFGDQVRNTNHMVAKGLGVKLDFQTVSASTILAALNKVINDTSYRTTAQLRSIQLRDQIETPLERAIWWTEYVIRHKGADHLKLHSRKLNYFQYFLYDVHLFLVAVVVGAFFSVKLIFRKMFCGKSAIAGVKPESNKKLN